MYKIIIFYHNYYYKPKR